MRLAFAAADAFTPAARLRIEQPAAVNGVGKYRTARHFEIERDAYVIPLGAAATEVTDPGEPSSHARGRALGS